MNVTSIKMNNVVRNGEVDLDVLLPEAVEGLDVIKCLDENKEILGAKNLLPLILENLKAINTRGTWSGNVYTVENVTFELLTDIANNITGIKVNGTSTGTNTILKIIDKPIPHGNYIVTGSPNGTSQTYLLEFININRNRWYGDFSGSSGTYVSSNDQIGSVEIAVRGGQNVNNIIFYPMIRLATDSNAAYQPYAMGNQELTQRLLSLESRVAALEG